MKLLALSLKFLKNVINEKEITKVTDAEIIKDLNINVPILLFNKISEFFFSVGRLISFSAKDFKISSFFLLISS